MGRERLAHYPEIMPLLLGEPIPLEPGHSPLLALTLPFVPMVPV